MNDLEVNLKHFDLGQLLLFLNHTGKTGRLKIDGSSRNGAVYLSEGKVVHCECGEMVGVEALYDLAMEEAGRAVFETGVSTTQKTFEEDMGNLAQEFERRRTEFKELITKLPPLDSVMVKSSSVSTEGGVSLRRVDWQVLALIDGKNTLKEVIEASKVGAFDAYKSLVWLKEQGLIVDPKEFERLVEKEINRIDIFLDEFARKGVGMERWRQIIEDWGKSSEENQLFINSLIISDQAIKLKELQFARLDRSYIKGMFDTFFKYLVDEGTNIYGKILTKRKLDIVMKRISEGG
ncbi:MAG: DUF4388 domain-containing protein [candidate division WOR-3 bacterium]